MGGEPALINAITEAIMARRGKREGPQIRFLCPIHPDEPSPSALWHTTKYVWKCMNCGAGGGYLDLARTFGIHVPAKLPGRIRATRQVSHEIRDVDRTVRAIHERIVEAATGKKVKGPWWCHPNGTPSKDGEIKPTLLPLYGIHELTAEGGVVVVEGEPARDALSAQGVQAVGTVTGATALPCDESLRPLVGRCVTIWRDNDLPGRKHGAGLAERLTFLGKTDVRILDWSDAPEHGDAADFTGDDRTLAELLASAVPFLHVDDGDDIDDDLRLEAEALLAAPDLIERISHVITEGGYAGDARTPVLAYIAITSRLLERPMNVAFIAASASGKNKAIDDALRLMPDEAYYLLGAGSARALVYSGKEFQHLMVIFAEADSIPEDGPAASAIRSIATDNMMCYDVVERDKGTNRFTTRHIRKLGPTGLITTSTKPLPPQMDTRVLSVGLPDNPAHTRAILEAHAAAVNGVRPEQDVRVFVAMQKVLASKGEHRGGPVKRRRPHRYNGGAYRSRKAHTLAHSVAPAKRCCCTPQAAWQWVDDLVTDALDGDRDVQRLVPHAVGHALGLWP